MNKNRFTILVGLTLILSACGTQAAPQQAVTTAAISTEVPPVPNATLPSATLPSVTQPAQVLKVMTHDSFAVSDKVVAAFEQQNNVKVQFLKSGDAGTALNKAILSKSNPLADVFYGVDNTFLSRALDEGIYEPYASPLLADIPQAFKLDPGNNALPVDYGDVCMNYDKAYLAQKNILAPQTLEDLLKPEYKSLVVVENPATSSPGLAFLLATIGHFGQDKYLDYWKGLVKNDLMVVNDWETAYNQQFTRGGGTRPVVLSYSSSPPFEVIYASKPISEPVTAAITAPGSCFRQVEFVGILKGTSNRDLSQKWVDYMLSVPFQEDMPLQMFVFPVNHKASLADNFTKYMVTPEKTAEVSPSEIAANREKWIQAWTEVVLH